MNGIRQLVAPLLVLPFLAGCQGEDGEISAGAGMNVVMVMPVTTSSDAAKEHLALGMHANDVGRFTEAKPHFMAAVEADPDFAFGYLQVANSANSFEEFVEYVNIAAEHAENASEAEQLQIQVAQTFLDNDAERRLQAAEQLVGVASESPRAWMTLAGVQSGRNHIEDSRASLMKAIELAPDFSAPYAQLGNNYLFLEPKDFDKAEENFVRVAELEPNEQNSYDLLGDVYRAKNELIKARDSYTRAAELDPDNASPPQQRGHVNSFLGDYDAAWADYDAAIALGVLNQPATFARFRAYVNVHAGDPAAAIEELAELEMAVDGMGIPAARGVKIAILTDIANIGMHSEMFEAARAALDRRAELLLAQAEEVGTEEQRLQAESNIAIFNGRLAARVGDFATARAKAAEAMAIVGPINNPRKNEPAHALLGLVTFLEGDYDAAIGHFAEGNPNNIYWQYYTALAHEGAGNIAEAAEIFDALAVYNFNFVGYALIRADVLERAM